MLIKKNLCFIFWKENDYLIVKQIIFLLLILLIGIVVTSELHKFLDIKIFDESYYLSNGIRAFNNFPKAENSPLYSLWYLSLSLIQPEYIKLYFLNYQILTIINALLLFILLTKNRVSPLISFILSVFFMISSTNFHTEPHVSHLCLSLILLTLIIILNKKITAKIFAVIIFIVLLASYIRPEYYLCFLLLIILNIILVIKRTLVITKSDLRLYIIFFATIIFFHLIFGFMEFNGKRSYIAFSQHYVVNYNRWNNIPNDPWNNYKDIISNEYKDANSIAEAFLINPYSFLKHIVTNISNSFHLIMDKSTEVILPNKVFKLHLPQRIPLIILFIFITTFYLLYRRYKEVPVKHFEGKLKLNFLQFLVLFFLFIPVILASIFIYPRDHYLLLLTPIPYLIIIQFNKNLLNNNIGKKTKVLIYMICIGIIFIILPKTKSYYPSNQKQPILNTIDFVKNLNIKTRVNIFENEGGAFSIYLGKNYNWINIATKKQKFFRFLSGEKINMIYLSYKLLNDKRMKSDDEWLYFLNNLSDYNFRQVSPSYGYSFLIHNSLLSQ